MSDRLLQIFNSSEEFVSGQEIANKLGISRNAVWKAVQKARKEGYEIEAVPRCGYRLVSSGEAYGENSIRAALKTKWLGKELIFMDEVDSTNEECKRRSRKGAGAGLVVVADTQSAGKGRRGRGWTSDRGTTISMSYLLKPDFSPDIAPMLTLIMAMAAAEGIGNVAGTEVGIKWPNDIVINGKKAVGILTEMTAEPDYIQEVIIGTGINVSVETFPDAIKDTATSIYLETGKKFSRALIVGEITTSFELYYERFIKEGNLSRLTDAYNSMCVNTGKRVRVLDPKGEYEAEAVGINEKGELIVETDSGELNNIYSGEVSVRGIYGYI